MVRDNECSSYPGFELSDVLLQIDGVRFILGEKFSQDPLEQHFSAQRRACGDNTNPTVEQYGYKELALHTIKSKTVKSLRGNCHLEKENQINFMLCH